MTAPATTGTDIYNGLAFIASAYSGDSDTARIRFLNRAIRASWPRLKLHERQSGGTFATNTYEYALSVSPAPHPDIGVYAVYSVDSNGNEADISRRGIQQWYDQSAGNWVLVMGGLADALAGQTFEVAYQYPHPDITALTDSIYLPFEYMVNYIEHLLARRKMTDFPNSDTGNWRAMMELALEMAEGAARQHQTPAKSPLTMYKSDRLG